MKIRCHQFLQGHSTKDGYAAPVLESKTEAKQGAPRSFAFSFNDSRREISDDKNTYILEIEPTDDTFQRTAAICSQWKTEGTPSKYTHWLIPTDDKTENTMLLLKRDSFMKGEELTEAYEAGKPLTLRDVEVTDEPQHPEWQMTDQQQKILGQFLALYWISLAQNHPSKGIAGNRIPLILRSAGSGELLTNEAAVNFFNKEIVTRLPFEAKGMISAVFGIKWSETVTNFKKAVCVILSTETGVPTEKKIDLMKGAHDLLSKFNHSDREAMNLIGKCLMSGESQYPEWYIRLRTLKGGIPKTTAPYLMCLSSMLQEAERVGTQTSAKVSMPENCYTGIYTKALEGGAEEEDIRNVLAPLANRISASWTEQPRPSVEFYKTKRNWLLNMAKMPQAMAAGLLEPLAGNVLDEQKKSTKISGKEKMLNALILLESLDCNEKSNVVNGIEELLASDAEEMISLISENSELPEIKTDSIERILQKWDKSKLSSKPANVIENVEQLYKKYPDISTETKDSVLTSLYRLWILNKVEELNENEKRGEMPTTDSLKELALYINKAGKAEESEKASTTGLSCLRKHYLTWIMEEPVVIPDDERFLDLAKEWIDKDLVNETQDFDAAQMITLEKNLLQTFEAYRETTENKNHSLSVFRRKKGHAQLEELKNNTEISGTAKAIKIAELHNNIRETDKVILEGTDLEEKFTAVMQDYFLDWSMSETPFASGLNGNYTDNWFVDVAEEWLAGDIKQSDYSPESIEKLEKNSINALKAYRIPEEQQKTLLNKLRNIRGFVDLTAILEKSDQKPADKALEIASIHDRLRTNAIEIHENLENELRHALTEEFLSWEKADKPFASNSQLKYSDDWFVSIAEDWLQYNLDNIQLNYLELEQLEKDITSVLNSYKVPKEKQQTMFLKLQKLWGEKKLHSVIEDEESDETTKAVQIASIHNRLSKIPGAIEKDDLLERELRDNLIDRFLAWGKATKPFPSGNDLRYDDAWFIDVAGEWLERRDDIRDLTSTEIEKLKKDLISVYGYHHKRENINETLLPLWKQWGETKLQELLQMEPTETVAMEIAGVHNQLQQIPDALDNYLEQDLENAILERFVIWGKCPKPFAGAENDPWFSKILNQWTDAWMDREYLTSDQLLALTKQVDAACRAYRIRENNDDIRKIRRAYADTYVRENAGAENAADAISKIAELLFRDRVVAEDEELRETLIDYLAESFELWAGMTPPFSLGESGNRAYGGHAQGETFTQILEKWQDLYLTDGEDSETLLKLRDTIRTGFDNFRIPQRELDQHVIKLDYQIKAGQFSEARSQEPTSETVANIAGIRTWIEENKAGLTETDHLTEEIDLYLVDNMDVWLLCDKPMRTEKYGYKNTYAMDLLEQWIENNMERKAWNLESVQSIKTKIETARKEYKITTGKDISQEAITKLNAFECQTFMDSLPETELNQRQIEEITERLLAMENDDMLSDMLSRKLVSNYLSWYKTEPPYSCGNTSPARREKLIIQITDLWIKQDCPADNLSPEELHGMIQNLKSLRGHQNTSTVEEIIKPLEMKYIKQRIQELSHKEREDYTADDLISIAGFYVLTKNNPDQRSLWEETREMLISHFADWGCRCDFRLPHDVENRYSEMDLTELTQSWLSRLHANDSNLEEIQNVTSRLKTSAISLYRMNQHETDQLIRLVEDYQNEIITNQLQRAADPPYKLLDEGFAAYGKMKERSDDRSGTNNLLRNALIRNYRKWVEGTPKPVLPEAFIEITKGWLKNEFNSISFANLGEYEKLRASIKKQINDLFIRGEDHDDIITEIEERWLREALSRFEQDPSSISEIAGYGRHIPDTNRMINAGDKITLDHFLLDHFVLWGKEDYQSTDGRNIYVYPEFANLVKEWMNSGKIRDLSVERMDRLQEKLSEALINGYGYSRTETEQLLEPIAARKKEMIIEQARQSMDEDSILLIRNMYRDTPEEVYKQVFDIFLLLAKKGESQDQITDFIVLQEDVWKRTKDPELQKGIIVFLNDLYKLYSNENRPIEMTDTMNNILEYAHYDLSPYKEHVDSWLDLKDQAMDKKIKKFVKNTDSIEDMSATWTQEYSTEYNLPWNKVVQRPVFEKELNTRLQNAWDDCDNESRVAFLHNLADYAVKEERDFRNRLLTITHDLMESSFDRLYSDPDNQQELDQIMELLQENRISTDTMKTSGIYKASIYLQQYETLLKNWDKETAIKMLMTRPEPVGDRRKQLKEPDLQRASEEDMILKQLLYYAYQDNNPEYWNRILLSLHIDLNALNDKDLKDIAATPFLKEMYLCYSTLTGNSILWATEELKTCIRNTAPTLWKTLHPFTLFGTSNVWKKLGGDQLPQSPTLNSFMNWLLKGK